MLNIALGQERRVVHCTLQEFIVVDPLIVVQVQLTHYEFSLIAIARMTIWWHDLEQAVIFETILQLLKGQ